MGAAVIGFFVFLVKSIVLGFIGGRFNSRLGKLKHAFILWFLLSVTASVAFGVVILHNLIKSLL